MTSSSSLSKIDKRSKLLTFALSISCLFALVRFSFFAPAEIEAITADTIFPGAFHKLGVLGNSGQYFYKRRLFSERFAAIIQGTTDLEFEEFREKFGQSIYRIDSKDALLEFEHFLSELSPKWNVEPPDLGSGDFGAINFGKHSSVKFFYSQRGKVMIIYGVKAF